MLFENPLEFTVAELLMLTLRSEMKEKSRNTVEAGDQNQAANKYTGEDIY